MATTSQPQVHLYALCLNEAAMIPHFLRHYDDIVSRFIVFDNGSTDDSVALLEADRRVRVETFETVGDSFVDLERRMADTIWKQSRGQADWVILAEVDEHLHHDDLRAYLAHCKSTGVTAIRGIGYNMVSDRFPTGTAPLWQQITHGLRSREFDKLAIFRPDAIEETNFTAGRHGDAPTGHVVYEPHPQVKLLHYKHLGVDYVAGRNTVLAAGLRAKDFANQWGRHYLVERDELETTMRAILYQSRRIPGLHRDRSGPLDLTWDDELSLITDSGLFSCEHYLRCNPDVADAGNDPLGHFCAFGWREGRRPNRHFDPGWYRGRYGDCIPAQTNPLLEYVLVGEKRGRMPVPYFDPSLYRSQFRLSLDASPLRHWLENQPA